MSNNTDTTLADAENTPVGVRVLDTMKGAFIDSLKRNNKKIRDDRAVAIAEDVQMMYKRRIEDTELELKKIKRERDAMLDLSPTTADSLVLVSDFNADAFVRKDEELGIKIRNTEIKLEVLKNRFAILFN